MPGHPKISCLKALWPRDDSRSKSLGACGRWNSCTSAGRRPIDGPGEPTVPARGTWAGLSWRTGAASEGSDLFWLSTPLLPKEGGGVGNMLSLCSAFGQLSGTVGSDSHARENSGIQSSHGVSREGF